MHHHVFFESVDTQSAIQQVSEWPDLVIYLGSGATVDRTGLTWRRLIDELLVPTVPNRQLREALLELYDPMRAASVAGDLYEQLYGDTWKRQLMSRLQILLYSHRECMEGRLLRSACMLALAFQQKGRPCILVTTNYDDYLIATLESILTSMAAGIAVKPIVIEDNSVIETDSLIEENTITCIHLHGLVPNPSSGRQSSEPILSEFQYHKRAATSAQILTDVLKGRHLLIVGSSMTDAPLLSALHATKPDSPESSLVTTATNTSFSPVEPDRVAVLPLQGREWSLSAAKVAIDDLKGLVGRRLHHLAVTPIFPPYFFQVGQFMDEIRTCLRSSCPPDTVYMDEACSYRYGVRLEKWWQGWLAATGASPATQASHHHELSQAMGEIRKLIDAPQSESLKLEVWIRWHPERERTLCLWASSAGTWPDIASMRRASVATNSDYCSVRIFCAGSADFMQANGDQTDARWRTYFGFPVWFEDVTNESVMQVGVVAVASMFGPDKSSIQNTNLARVKRAIPVMERLGRRLLIDPATGDAPADASA